MAQEKLLDAVTFKCTADMKQEIAALAMADGIESSEFVRDAVEALIAKRRADYLALHAIFGKRATAVQEYQE